MRQKQRIIFLVKKKKIYFSTGEKEMVILEREAYAFTSGIALGTVLFKVNNLSFIIFSSKLLFFSERT